MPERSIREVNHVPILNGQNYPLWSILIEVELSARGLRDVCSSDLSPGADALTVNNWNQLNVEAVQLILSRLHPEIIITVVDGSTVKNAKLLWNKINTKFASQTITNRGRTWVRWECLRFNGNIEEYVKECSNILFDIAGIGISLPPDIMAYSILGKISRDSNAYDHVIDSMVLKMNLTINPQQVLDKLSELLQHKNTKTNFQKGIKTEENSALLTDSSSFPYKITYVCRDGKHNPKNTTHKPENCWAEHPELRPNQKKNKRKSADPETHQTGLEALFTSKEITTTTPLSSLVIDCGATHHMFHDRNLFKNLVLCPDEKIATSDPSSNLLCKGRGSVEISINNKIFQLENCLYVPRLTRNLVSLLDLCSEPITITRNGLSFCLSKHNQPFLSGSIINKLMIVAFNQPSAMLANMSDKPPWHDRLGHPGDQVLKSLGLKITNMDPCVICARAKMTSLPFKGSFDETSMPLDCIHMDVVGPISPASKSGHRYFLTIIDQHTSFKITKFLKNKSDVYDEFVIQLKYMENVHERKIKKVVTDGGGEFVNQQFKELANQSGFIHVIAPPYTPEHNGVAERANRTIVDKARCLLLMSKLPSQYWAEAINTATYLTNIIPIPSKNNLSPFQLWTKNAPKIKKIRTFGCKVVFLIPKHKRIGKLAP
ncbi:hypothetical protein O181_074424 [Austropuccinia psidii MF-1]|uniref:Integrase catalytic domain-containing protein n=1 Tax=Austropuccinia psidii MF-1 TaxID=1389203 RepID=A0A9Q3F915_9BASI|nr:hypothetical protein [Austropuccinia psidii MF-1]